jgi:porphobilinogen synthase
MELAMFPATRLRRQRQHPVLRDLVRETTLTVNDLILPLFVRPGKGVKKEIVSMPGNYQLSVDRLVEDVGAAVQLGIRAFILFGIPAAKDAAGTSAWADDGIVQQALRALKAAHKDILLITDECFCEYTDHGHCGVLTPPLPPLGKEGNEGRRDVDNDATLPNLARQCVSHAQAGADVVAPSGMMDGMVLAIRHGLDDAGFSNIPIMSYAAKYASGFYGPFRDAAESPPQFGDRSSYQMDPGNSDDAMREVALDLEEGADIIMVKPALAYMDIIRRVKDRFGVPTAAYNVSGEFAMVKAAAAKGWIDERRVAMEILTSIKRAGADMILTYYAPDAAKWLK